MGSVLLIISIYVRGLSPDIHLFSLQRYEKLLYDDGLLFK